MILLAIDTATESCSAALWAHGKTFHRSTVEPRKHAELILPFIDELLIEAHVNKKHIQGLIVGQGPGAFTGVRIGVGVVQGLALALGVSVVAVSNLQTLAFSAYKQLKTNEEKTVVVATDARMNEVYSAKYLIQGKSIKPLGPETVGKPEDVNLSNTDIFIGSGFAVYSDLINYKQAHPMPYDVNVYSQAQDMLLMVREDFMQLARPIEDIEPVYLREP